MFKQERNIVNFMIEFKALAIKLKQMMHMPFYH